MHGTKNSLNVGIAAGIALASWREQIDAASTDVVTYSPLAIFRSAAKHPYEAPRQASIDASGLEGTIELPANMRETLRDLEGFDRIWLLYDFHHNKTWKPLVLPPRGEPKKRGVFATRSPYRPNSIGLSCVELVKIENRTITVKATDLLDGTPILDIKPYVAYADSFPDAREGWLEGADDAKFAIAFAPRAEAQLVWLEERGLNTLRGFLSRQLEFDPLDRERKRLIGTDQIAYRTWRARFSIENQTVFILEISSGYSEKDLETVEDKYGDKDLHRAFTEQMSD
jgi:tRNA-Thr(GGU) m(6)t(6)A37 methyltransferase TsaA